LEFFLDLQQSFDITFPSVVILSITNLLTAFLGWSMD
jgi:hypothetical protein